MSKKLLLVILVVLASIAMASAAQRCIEFSGLCETLTLNTDDLLLRQVHGISSTAACGIPGPDVVVSGTFTSGELRLTRASSCDPSSNIYYVFDLDEGRAFTYLQDGVTSIYIGDDVGSPFTVSEGACPAPDPTRMNPKPSLLERMPRE